MTSELPTELWCNECHQRTVNPTGRRRTVLAHNVMGPPQAQREAEYICTNPRCEADPYFVAVTSQV